MATKLKTQLGMPKAAMRILADNYFQSFQHLASIQHYHTAIYISGYSVELYLKCAICQNLKVQNLPTVFEYHDLESLLFFAGLQSEISSNPLLQANWNGIQTIWDVEMRYDDPRTSSLGASDCAAVEMWLNGRQKGGLIPWLQTKI